MSSSESSDQTYRDLFWDSICSFYYQIMFFFLLTCVLIVMSLLSFVVIDPGSDSFVILTINFVILGIAFPMAAIALYQCKKRQ